MRKGLTGLPKHFTGPNPFLPEGVGGGGGEGGGGGKPDDKGGSGEGKPDDDKGEKYTPPASQADLDRIISERLARDRRSNFADYDELKRKAAEHDKAIEDAKTEQQKAVDAARKEGETAALQTANRRLVAAEARALAAEGKWRVSATAVVRQLDLSGVKVTESGDVDADAIKVALADLAKNEPGLVDDGKGGKPKPDSTQGGSGGEQKPSGVAAGRDLWESTHPKRASAST